MTPIKDDHLLPRTLSQDEPAAQPTNVVPRRECSAMTTHKARATMQRSIVTRFSVIARFVCAIEY